MIVNTYYYTPIFSLLYSLLVFSKFYIKRNYNIKQHQAVQEKKIKGKQYKNYMNDWEVNIKFKKHPQEYLLACTDNR
jgi:hypothetical protein